MEKWLAWIGKSININPLYWLHLGGNNTSGINSNSERLDKGKFKDIIANSKDSDAELDNTLIDMSESRGILEQSVLQLENLGSLYKTALENTKTMLNNPLF